MYNNICIFSYFFAFIIICIVVVCFEVTVAVRAQRNGETTSNSRGVSCSGGTMLLLAFLYRVQLLLLLLLRV